MRDTTVVVATGGGTLGGAQLAATRALRGKEYELKDHLGDVRVVIGDIKLRLMPPSSGLQFKVDLHGYNNYYPFGMVQPERSFNLAGYRYGFGGHEKEDEIKGIGKYISFGDYGYDPRIGRRNNIDPEANELVGVSPYSYALNNPITYVDNNGRLPIIPLLLKAGAAGAADMLMQAAMAYYFDPEVKSIGQAFESVNWWQVGRSAAEGLIPWKIPGGRVGKAAATAVGDVLVNAFDKGAEYSQEQALQDFFVGFIGDLAGGGLGELVSKYGTKGVANGLLKFGFDTKYIRKLTGGLSNPEVRQWYSDQVKKINVTLKPTEENARAVVGQRNSLKQRARELMSDRVTAEGLYETDPIRDFEYYYDKYSKQGLSGESLYQRIMQGSTTPNQNVNERLGVK